MVSAATLATNLIDKTFYQDSDGFPGRLKRMTAKLLRSLPGSSVITNDADRQGDVLLAMDALETALKHCDFQTVLDVGSGAGKHAELFHQHGKSVTTIDFGKSIYYQKRDQHRTDIIADYYKYQFDHPFDLVWASHVLEHQPNPNDFLKKVHRDTKEGGWVVITVPPLKHQIVGGHLSLWNAGMLLYHLVFAGFDCRTAWVKRSGYNISVIVDKRSIVLPELHYDSGDINRLSAFLPHGLGEGFDGNIRSMNWPD
ncbi:class I SAM-dependent methyltransferase [Crateriforma conspicua]|uniref:Bifunctional 3-demethylubiquinone-9 3-methyltransferase/ 2-octaprenyl-6-hydroxy phenol methylase n=1 Tax=Crateriforma conspicua TaxID=2527996 RepID=A0A5C6FXD1_9PLAN|nr:class I SAM-dependent methyltransferase [Crateriforma conspicua]TWU67667.1 bifunctional 3-demethylubiquinone-9 3-methyltransferase/ 2-octaprenyl-6-hydroxy phenol methylase [Crateriforma conspicua]